MSSSAIRQTARQVLKNLDSKYKLFLVPILLTFLSGGLAFYTRYQLYSDNTSTTYQYPVSLSLPGTTAFPQLVSILTFLFSLAAAYTMLEVVRQKRQSVDYNDLGRTFNGTYLLHLFILFLVRILMLLPWTILCFSGIFLSLISMAFGSDNNGSIGTGLLIIGLIMALVGTVFLIIKNYAYSQAEMILFDRVESNQSIDPFELLKDSKELMAGHKFDLFLLQFSFIGWHLLSVLTLGLLTIYVLPYTITAEVVFYDELQQKKLTEEPTAS